MSKVLVIAAICVTGIVAYFTRSKKSPVLDLYDDDSDDLDQSHWLRKAEPVNELGMLDVPTRAAVVKIETTAEERQALSDSLQYWSNLVNYYSTQTTGSRFLEHIHTEFVQICDDIRRYIADSHYNYSRKDAISEVWYRVSNNIAEVGIMIENIKRTGHSDFEGELFYKSQLQSLEDLVKDYEAIGNRMPGGIIRDETPPPPAAFSEDSSDSGEFYHDGL